MTLPWSAFDFPQASTAILRRVKTLAIAAKPLGDAGGGEWALRAPRVVAAPAVALHAAVRGKPATPGASAEYAVEVANATDGPESVAFSFARYGWESMTPSVEPAAIALGPGESRAVTVRVDAGSRVPAGGHEPRFSSRPPTATPRARRASSS